jgi:hypothetical protein
MYLNLICKILVYGKEYSYRTHPVNRQIACGTVYGKATF